MGAAAPSCLIAGRSIGARRATGPICRSAGRRGADCSTIHACRAGRIARRRSGNCAGVSRAGPVARDDDARSRKSRATDRAVEGGPGAVEGGPGAGGPRKCQGPRGAQGGAGKNDTSYGQGVGAGYEGVGADGTGAENFSAEPARRHIGASAAGACCRRGTQARADPSVTASQSAAAGANPVAASRTIDISVSRPSKRGLLRRCASRNDG
jgi:hypothetical protein